jgi:hypothetical protein
MKFGIDFFPDAQPDVISGQRSFEDALDLAEEADAPYELDAFNVPLDESRARFEEGLETHRFLRNFRRHAKAWTGRRFR